MTEQNHDHLIVLKKRLSTCRSPKGSLVSIPDDLIIEIVRSWEKWTGSSKALYAALGIKKEQLACIINKGKRLSKEHKDKLGPFTPVEVKSQPCDENTPMVLSLDKKKSIRFYQVNDLIEFLKKSA